MKKLFFLTALLCASVMTFAVDQDTWIGSTDAQYNNQFKWYEIDGVATPQEVVNIQKPGWSEEIGIYTHKSGYNKVTFNGVVKTNGTHYKQDGAGVVLFISALTQKNTDVLFYDGDNVVWGLRVYNDKGEAGDDKTDPELTLNISEKTLNADDNDTCHIIATHSGNGALSCKSSNDGIATVIEEDGKFVVTAVGRGTATITISIAETDTYAASSKKATITVNGPINWAGIDWLSGSNDKYKLFITPYFGDEFGGKRIENNTNLWIGFPSASFGEMSIEPSDGAGAWKTFALTNFPKKENQFTVECGGTNYTFDVYYADGSDIPAAIENVEVSEKARKVFENGQLVIIKNGVKYNALGAELR